MYRPSNSNDVVDAIGHGISGQGDPPAATGKMKPSLRLVSRDVLAEPDSGEVGFDVVLEPAVSSLRELAAAPELGERASPTVGARDHQRHDVPPVLVARRNDRKHDLRRPRRLVID